MSQVVFDPDDPSVAIIGVATDVAGFTRGATVIYNVHDALLCEGQGCVIHHPSDHHMRTWPLVWRGDTRVMERQCPHGVGHPDPDSAAFHLAQGEDWWGVHGCDGCCSG